MGLIDKLRSFFDNWHWPDGGTSIDHTDIGTGLAGDTSSHHHEDWFHSMQQHSTSMFDHHATSWTDHHSSSFDHHSWTDTSSFGGSSYDPWNH